MPLDKEHGPYDISLLFETPGEPGTVFDPRAEGCVVCLLEPAVIVGRQHSFDEQLGRRQLTVRLYVPARGRAELEQLLERWELQSRQAGVTLVNARVVQAAGWYRQAALRLFADQ